MDVRDRALQAWAARVERASAHAERRLEAHAERVVAQVEALLGASAVADPDLRDTEQVMVTVDGADLLLVHAAEGLALLVPCQEEGCDELARIPLQAATPRCDAHAPAVEGTAQDRLVAALRELLAHDHEEGQR